MDEIAKSTSGGVAQPRDLIGAEITDEGRFDPAKRLDPPPGIVAWHQGVAPGEIERGLEVGETAVGAGAPAPHVFGVLRVEGRQINRSALARAPVAGPLGKAAVPVAQALRCQFGDRQLAERRQNVAIDNAFDALDRLATAPAVVLQIVGYGDGDRVGAVGSRTDAGGEPLFLDAPFAGELLGLREVHNGVAVRILQVVGKAELGLAINAFVIASARDPAAAGGAAPVAEVQTLFDHAPVWL